MTSSQAVSAAVAQLYNTYPFPPEPLLDEPPPGYNWRWHWAAAYSFCAGHKPLTQSVRVLDAGCGTGVGTEYIAHLNPEAEITAIDLSDRAIEVARERCQRSGASNITFQPLSIYDIDQLPGTFDWINCVGVLHHLPDPIQGLQKLASKLAPGGIIHIFVYAALGRWEISLMQEAIALLQGDRRGDYTDGVQVGRQLFAHLPEQNRLRRREQDRWAWENQRDASFADMYVHPQEVDYSVDTLFELIDASGLDFLGFSNPTYWNLERLIGQVPDLMARAARLSLRQRYRLIEVLDPEITHYEFFLAQPPFNPVNWSDQALLQASPERNPCMHGWPSRSIMDCNYQPMTLTEAEYAFVEKCDQQPGSTTVADCMALANLEIEAVRSLLSRQLIMLSPCS
ncbi:MAG: class I SAM-dependent methyltransferase [Leptolyngbya sp. RL_3_1]|nr:class I SAM-dependent methyltransferase [Leptolyngbya sp. RL_3_1]